MFPLNTNAFPASAAELASLLNQSLRKVFSINREPVQVEDAAYPHLAALHVSLDGAELSTRPPPLPSPAGKPIPALTVDSFTAGGANLSVGPAAIDFSLKANAVELYRADDHKGKIVLILRKAAEGRIEASVSQSNLETLIADVAKTEAGKHGVTIDDVQLSLRSQSPRSLAAEVQLHAKKLFVSATLRITGQLDLDGQLNARISGLDCVGPGAIAGIACGVLKPHLEKLNGREFPLMSLPLGEVRLHDVRIAVADKLSVMAQFGSAHE